MGALCTWFAPKNTKFMTRSLKSATVFGLLRARGFRFWRALLVLAPILASACVAYIEDPPHATASGGAPDSRPAAVSGGHSAGTASGGAARSSSGGFTGGVAGEAACGAVTERRVRRLTATEYTRAVSALTFVDPFPLSAPDPVVHGFDNNADALGISTGNFEDFRLSAELTAGAFDVSGRAPCASPTQGESCARDFAASLAERAFGRRPSDAELTSQLDLYRQASSTGGYEAGIRAIVQAVLMSPYFLYRIELGSEAGGEGEVQLTAEEAANALSFALTGERPDAELLNRLRGREPAVSRELLREQAARLAVSAASRAHFQRFLRALFGVSDLRAVNKIPAVFPTFTPELKVALDTELSLFFDRALGPGGGTLNSVLGASETFVNRSLLTRIYAADYQDGALPATPETGEFVAIPFNSGLRRGLLGTAAWLAAHSPVHRSSPVDRGLAVRSRLLCLSLSPPAGLSIAQPGSGDADGTTRQKFERHAQDPLCNTCHQWIDPIGFGLEMMDAIGSYRVEEAGLPVNSAGNLTGTDVDGPFAGPAELAERLMQSRDVRACFVTQLFRFMEGRDERREDACELRPLQQFFADPARTFAELSVEMVLRPKFLARRREP
jgi:hypothetical protein